MFKDVPGSPSAGEMFAQLRKKVVDVQAQDTLERELRGVSHPADTLTFEPLAIDGSFNPQAIEPRDWLSVGLLLREHVTLLISPGGVGKSTFSMLIAVAVALERSGLIPGRQVAQQGNALIINTEDDMQEMLRRLAGILQHYDIAPTELAGKLRLSSLYGQNGLLARHDGDDINDGPLFSKLVGFCQAEAIKLIVIDPLVGFHDADENTNGAMEKVATTLRRVARLTGAAVLVAHHTRKSQGSETHAGDMDAGRGASALAAAARIAITLARMSKTKAKDLNIDWKIATNLRRIDDAKQNYAPAAETVSWFEMVDTRIANNERVGVPVPFDMSGVAEHAAEQKKQEAEDTQLLLRNKVARLVVGDKSEGSMSQPAVIDDYGQAAGVKRTCASNHIRQLPIGKENALQFSTDKRRPMVIWRTRTGTEKQPRYTVEWAEKPNAQA